jgi:hypothetical protein
VAVRILALELYSDGVALRFVLPDHEAIENLLARLQELDFRLSDDSGTQYCLNQISSAGSPTVHGLCTFTPPVPVSASYVCGMAGDTEVRFTVRDIG